jgi:hypothetical protein
LLNHVGSYELALLGVPVVFLLAYRSVTALFRQLRVLQLRTRYNWLMARREELGGPGARPQAQPRGQVGPRRQRFPLARDLRQLAQQARTQARVRHVEHAVHVAHAGLVEHIGRGGDEVLTAMLLAWARSADPDFFCIIHDLAQLGQVQQARIAKKLMGLAQLDDPQDSQMTLPRDYDMPADRYAVLFQDKHTRLQLRAVLGNVRDGCGTLSGIAHIFSPHVD